MNLKKIDTVSPCGSFFYIKYKSQHVTSDRVDKDQHLYDEKWRLESVRPETKLGAFLINIQRIVSAESFIQVGISGINPQSKDTAC